MNEDKVISIFILSKLNVKSRSVRVYTLKRSMKRGLKIELLEKVVEMLAMGEPLPEKNNDHALAGDWIGHRECHILPDWLLIYRIEGAVLVLCSSVYGILSTEFSTNLQDISLSICIASNFDILDLFRHR